MHYPQCNGKGNNLKLTQLDKDGAKKLYGAPGTPLPVTVTEKYMGRLTKGTISLCVFDGLFSG